MREMDVTIRLPELEVPRLIGVTRSGRPVWEARGGAITTKWYGLAIAQAFGGTGSGTAPNIDWLSDTIKAMATTSSYSPDQDAHDFKDDVTNEVAAGGGYSTGGATVGSKTLAYDSGTNVISFGCAAISWSGATFTFRRVVVYDSTPGTDATDPLIGWIDMGADVTGLGGAITITPPATGLFSVTIS